MKLKNYIINEAAYPGNIGFEELVEFYNKASKKDIKKMEQIIKNNDWHEFRKIINNTLNIKLK